MTVSTWSDEEANRLVATLHAQGVNRDIALEIYATRQLGLDPSLVLHGGGNTSVKTAWTDIDGREVDVLCVKGSGADMGTIGLGGMPLMRIAELVRLIDIAQLSDDHLVMLQRRMLLDPAAPSPSIEALLHGIIPQKFVNHTHANAIVSLTNQPRGEDLVRELFPDALIVPYVMPGFDLAKATYSALAGQPDADGIILLKHGIFTFSDDARDAYERMIAMVDKAERRLSQGRSKPFASITLPHALADASQIAPILRGAIAIPGEIDDVSRRFVLEHRASPEILEFCNAPGLQSLVSRGNATPEHVLRIKRTGVALPAPRQDALDAFRQAVEAAVAAYSDDYRQYFGRNAARAAEPKTMLDTMPRVFYVPGIGLFAAGPTKKAAAAAADVAEATVEVITRAEGIDRFESLSEADLFDIEYWSLEQAKLAKAQVKPLTGQVAVITGGAGSVGSAIATALKAEGAEIALFDLGGPSLEKEAARLGALGVACDVTDVGSVDAAVARTAAHFGGVDILVSNAGIASQGRVAEVSDDVFRRDFDVNFWGHQSVARAVVKVMEQQGNGGALLFNLAKQAVRSGPYETSIAALLALVQQYAIEHGASGITANAVHSDGVHAGLMAPPITANGHVRSNLIGREVTTTDVADAFVYLAKARVCTGVVLSIDGGNVGAMMR
ncbi:bifunctional aldolase/short-chain dehydrogenase [Devosia ginsengisoli]|uniref:Bifunctional aldolase/short-chain dehydrogenase n=1 Tax=Devosia ginsengisoli TaxID=400770 RepID=A0A5B8LQJ8_9HYPH|nr:bifunctional aldolase/short-chain dehydrogenase [Devosia ginsengisoli]QDZ09500.1 bifunctional aldolase/short-chain dehydrogenase [Devosia ginsengisoli]